MSYTDSTVATGTLTLQGIWLHDPLDAQETARQYLYGGPPGQLTSETPDRLDFYAGRELPVVDFSPHRSDAAQVSLVVPFAPDWSAKIADLQAFSVARRTLVYRDGRGRRIAGRMFGYMERDEKHGTNCSFQMTRTGA